jgi:hypothetical protein
MCHVSLAGVLRMCAPVLLAALLLAGASPQLSRKAETSKPDFHDSVRVVAVAFLGRKMETKML